VRIVPLGSEAVVIDIGGALTVIVSVVVAVFAVDSVSWAVTVTVEVPGRLGRAADRECPGACA